MISFSWLRFIFPSMSMITSADLYPTSCRGSLLVVSQFTLYADCRKGRRPSFVKAGSPEEAEKMYRAFIGECRKRIPTVKHGEFGAYMQVELVNDGPFTIVLDSDEL